MKLYGSLTSPYTRKARIVILEKDLDCEFIEETVGQADARYPELNPLGKVPALEYEDGTPLYDSPVIVEYLDHLEGEHLIPTRGDERWEVQRWHALGDGVMDAVVARYLELRRPEQVQMEEVIEKQERKIRQALTAISHAVSGREVLVGDSFTMADLAVGVALEYIDLRYPHDWRNQWPRLAYWLAGISARPSFKATVPPGLEAGASPRH